MIDPEQFPDGLFELMALGVCGTRPDNCGAPPGEAPTYVAVTAATGSRDLDAETTTSIELGWAGRFRGFEASATVYRTWTKEGSTFRCSPTTVSAGSSPGTADDVVLPSDPNHDGIEEAPRSTSALSASASWRSSPRSATTPADRTRRCPTTSRSPCCSTAGSPRCSATRTPERCKTTGSSWDFRGRGARGLRRGAQLLLAVGSVERRGPDVRPDRDQARQEHDAGITPDTSEFVNIPARHRVSASVGIEPAAVVRLRAAGTTSPRTFWQDVLTSDYWGFVSGYNLVGVRGGWRWPRQGLELTRPGNKSPQRADSAAYLRGRARATGDGGALVHLVGTEPSRLLEEPG